MQYLTGATLQDRNDVTLLRAFIVRRRRDAPMGTPERMFLGRRDRARRSLHDDSSQGRARFFNVVGII